MTEEIEIYSIEDIERNKNAEGIYVSSWIDFTVDLSNFEKLKYARLNNKKRINLNSCTMLEELIITKVDKVKDDLTTLSDLKVLDISEGNITDLAFLDDMPKLNELTLSYLYKLEDVSGLSYLSDSLEYLEVLSCKNIVWNDELKNLPNLKKIIFRSKFNFDGLKWVEKMPNLEHLALGDTLVENGDFRPAKDIYFVSMDNKKHYNYKYDHETLKIVPK